MFRKFLHLSLARKAATITASISFCACIILILASYQSNRQLIFHSAEMLGENLAQQLARDASNSLVQGDKLSLQSILNGLVKSPVIVHGAIYDVENRAVAEAGKSQSKTAQNAFSASITFQDSLAGYAVITIDTSPLQQEAKTLLWQLLFLSLLISMLSYLLGSIPARYLAAAINDLTMLASKPPRTIPANIHLGYRGSDEFQQLTQRVIEGPEKIKERTSVLDTSTEHRGDHTVLFLDISNLNTLKEQRNQQDVNKLVSSLHDQLTTICKLYDGEPSVSSSHGFSAKFLTTNENDHPFRALCATYLIEKQLKEKSSSHGQNPMQIHLGVALCEAPEDASADNSLSYQLSVQQTLEHAQRLCESSVAEKTCGRIYASATILQHPSVKNRVNATAVSSDCSLINNFDDSYKALLEKQLAALAVGTPL